MRVIFKHFLTTVLILAATVSLSKPLASAAVSDQDGKTVTVKGTVKGTDGEPQIGAMVYVKGIATTTASSAMTDANGEYSLSAPSGAVLVASLLGFKEQEQSIGGRNVVNFILEQENTILDDAVVIGYGTQSKLTLTGSVAQTSGRELVKTPRSTSRKVWPAASPV